MMKLLFSIPFLSLPFFFLTENNFEPDLEYTQVIKREFPTKDVGMLKLLSKFGKIEVQNWDQSKVKIDIRIVVEAPNERTASQSFDRINIHFIDSPNLIKAITEISPASRRYWTFPNSSSTKKEDFSINFKVFIPFGFNLELDMQYGDLVLGEIKQSADIIFKHGNIEIAKVHRQSRLDLELVEGNLGKLNNGELTIENSNLKISQANTLTINSNNTEINIKKINDLRLNSKYDNYDIDQIGRLKNTGKYDNILLNKVKQVNIVTKDTKIVIGQLDDRATLDLNGGQAMLKKVNEGFKELILIGYDAQFKVNMSSNANYQLDAIAYQGGIYYPNNLKVNQEMMDSDEHLVKGHTENKQFSYQSSIIRAQLKKGGLRINQE